MLEIAVYIIVFIALSGLMAMVDAAVLSVSPAEIEGLVARQAWGAGALQRISRRITRAVVIIVLITNTINILGPILAGKKAIELYGDPAIGVVTAILTFGTIVFSEIIPKSLGTHYAPKISRVAAPIILLLVYGLWPVVVALEWISKLLMSGERRIGTEAQIRSLASLGRRQGFIENDEGQLIHRAFKLNDRSAEDVMTPLKDLVSLDADATIRSAAQTVVRNDYSRLPVFGKSIHELQGMALSRDILQAMAEDRHEDPLSSIIRPALEVEATLPSDSLMVLFRDKRIHQAVVRKESKTIGVVTLEDVLEELVGEIEDEERVGKRQ